MSRIRKRRAIKELSKKYAELRDKIEGNDDISNMSMDDISRLTDMERDAARDLIGSVLADKKESYAYSSQRMESRKTAYTR